MLPCKKESYRHAEEGAKLCKKKGEVPLLSVEALHQLHIFIFILGLVHVVFCATTILLGGAKIRKWKHWETGIHREMHLKLRQIESTPLRVVRNHQGDFVSERTKGFWMKLAVVSWIIAFLKQFHDSVSKSDYKALRSAFGLKHFPKHPFFDFHKYTVRALEHDFKRVVGISWYLWLFVILFLLLNVNGWHTYFWLAFLPLFLLLVVGAKLEHIITRLAQEAAASLSDETEGVPNIKPSKDHFWFGRPEIVLKLIHFILFQNSFEIGFFFWVLVTYGFDSCIMEKKVYAISRLVIGMLIQVICSYVTLPLYAIVTHMDGGIKLQGIGSGLSEYVAEWASGAKKKKGQSRLSLLSAPTWKNPGGDPATEVEVTHNGNEHFGGSPRNALAPPPDLDEIVSVVDDGIGGNHHRR
uniref:MLO-like protein n=2 Tax=Oryza meyeriana var. granulata TaxID=110450 RepID=C0JAF7_9ORYZ|nr:Mlo family protein [Oryza meyeriana var. granulata]